MQEIGLDNHKDLSGLKFIYLTLNNKQEQPPRKSKSTEADIEDQSNTPGR